MNRRYRKTIIAGNWKMNKTATEAKKFADDFKALLPKAKWCDVVVCVPSVDISAAVRAFKDSRVAVGAQNLFYEDHGAYTGEVSAAMLCDLGVKYVIVGHSERRAMFGETDEDINKKAKVLMAHGIVPISCCGEPLEVREAGTHVDFVVNQIKADTEGLEISDPSKYVVAYEPIWAIGTGKTATADDAQEVCGAIRKTLAEVFGQQTADGIRVLYGGSAKPENVAGFLEKEDVDGALVGGASLKADSFAAMVKAAM